MIFAHKFDKLMVVILIFFGIYLFYSLLCGAILRSTFTNLLSLQVNLFSFKLFVEFGITTNCVTYVT